MKLDLILLNVTKNVDNEVSVKGSPTSATGTAATGVGGSSSGSPSNNNNTSTIVRTLQNLSESIQCYGAARYLELSSQVLDLKSTSSASPQAPNRALHYGTAIESTSPEKRPESDIPSPKEESVYVI
jgi:hypothetical protein